MSAVIIIAAALGSAALTVYEFSDRRARQLLVMRLAAKGGLR